MSSTHTVTLTHMAVIPECLHTTHPADMVEISQLLCKAETRMLSLMSKSYMADRLDSYRCFVNVCEWQEVYCFWSEDFSKTLASTTMEGFSMSALLCTILSSS
ncbi:hypothetical protein CHARACLAT_031586 [Characodon lateralis]|uniref:Uncharacterized protein n=1 Tax=Characodon lateralis TaxID=208331 RepID=A0ABU7DC04_9TELE|nr:hypothetical protein [Characodon lateralis]